MRSVPSRCDLGVRSRRSRRRDLGSGFTDDLSRCDAISLSNDEIEGLWVHRRSLSVRSGFDSISLSNSKVEGCEVEGLWALGSISLWVRSLSLFGCDLSLSLCVSSEMVWSENFHFKPFSPHITYFTVNTENIFSLTQFSGPTKQPIFWKSISEFSLKSKQTEPNCTILTKHATLMAEWPLWILSQ